MGEDVFDNTNNATGNAIDNDSRLGYILNPDFERWRKAFFTAGD